MGLQKKKCDELFVSAIELSINERLSWSEIAERMDISRQTLAKWRRDPDFQRLLRNAINAIFAESATRHKHALNLAFRTLEIQALSKENDAQTRIKAATALIEKSFEHQRLLLEMEKITEIKEKQPIELIFNGFENIYEPEQIEQVEVGEYN